MTIPEASKQLNLSEQLLRVWIQSGRCLFGTIVRKGCRNTYYINEERMKAWIEGRLKNE